MKNKPIELKGYLAEKFPRNALLFGGAFLALSFILGFFNHHHFYFSYLTSYIFFLTMTLGCLFMVLIHFLTRAGWSVVIRRIPEFIMKNVGIMIVLFIPILFGLHDLYHWTHTSAIAHDPVLQAKSAYLNVPFFLVRAGLFFVIWLWLTSMFFRKSVFQDRFPEEHITLRLQRYATFGMIIYALTQSFAFIDWVMSLTPHWYSTMFGVYFFAGSVVVALSATTLLLMFLRKRGFLADIVNVEHYHDLGKLLYGFNIFWTYIAFSQYFLIWYANIPEETVWYLDHFNGSWNTVAIILAVGHFGVPFIMFISRHAKRNLKFHFGIVVWMLAMHFLDMYWIIMPNATPDGFHFNIMDLTCFLGIAGVFIGTLFLRMKKHSLYPYQDPRLEESLKFENV